MLTAILFYEQLPDPNKKVELNGYGNAAEAKETLQKAIEAYKTKK
ncbi:Uncharacterised protein [Oligella ureolytica]|uniref:Uncharacterized protein n=1 Tax=Oligella ureolytica TaxID=90244 RepID=A0A378XF13_9BURK|nr:hypothetical protein [Oligella ureolytica]SUA54994.1 Uncharacterised protein [Oligella ureolytica]